MGHQEKVCSIRTGDARSGKLQIGQYGLWMKAETTKAGPKNSSPPHSRQVNLCPENFTVPVPSHGSESSSSPLTPDPGSYANEPLPVNHIPSTLPKP